MQKSWIKFRLISKQKTELKCSWNKLSHIWGYYCLSVSVRLPKNGKLRGSWEGWGEDRCFDAFPWLCLWLMKIAHTYVYVCKAKQVGLLKLSRAKLMLGLACTLTSFDVLRLCDYFAQRRASGSTAPEQLIIGILLTKAAAPAPTSAPASASVPTPSATASAAASVPTPASAAALCEFYPQPQSRTNNLHSSHSWQSQGKNLY